MFVKPGETIEEAIANFKRMKVGYFLRELRTLDLEKFKKLYGGQYDIKEVKPSRDGVAYFCAYEYIHHTRSEFNDYVGMLWNKDGKPLGFVLQGEKYMFDKEILPEQEYGDVQDDGSFIKVKLNSDLARDMSHNPFGGDGKVYVVNPAVNGVSYVFPMRQVRSLAPKGSNGRVVVKSVFFDALCMYDASGRLIETQVTDKDFFDKWIVPPEMKLKKAEGDNSGFEKEIEHGEKDNACHFRTKS